MGIEPAQVARATAQLENLLKHSDEVPAHVFDSLSFIENEAPTAHLVDDYIIYGRILDVDKDMLHGF